MSRLLAERASGEVIFVSGDKDSTTQKYGNTWENIEKPTLMKNPDVTMIVEIKIKDPSEVKTITFPHGITQEIKTKYPIFANLKEEFMKIDYYVQPIKFTSLKRHMIGSEAVKRSKSPVKPLQLRNSKQIDDKKSNR